MFSSSDKSLILGDSEFYYLPAWHSLRVFGPDSASWLHGIATGNVQGVRPGQACWSSLLTKQGKVQADLQIVGDAQELILALPGDDSSTVQETLDAYLVMEDAEIEPSEERWIVAFGSRARTRLESLGLRGGRVDWCETDVSVWSFKGDALAAPLEGSRFISSDEFASWCVRHGVPQFGRDYSSADNLHAASLERRTVDWSKGCYLGQEVVCMQDMRGKVKQRLVHLTGPELDVSPGDLVLGADGRELGKVTSSTHGVAIASVRAAGYEPGSQLKVGATSVLVSALR